MNDAFNYGQPERQFIYQEGEVAPVIKVWEWVVILILLSLPVVNIILIFAWALDNKSNPNRSNFARAALVLVAFHLVLLAVFFGSFVGMLSSLIQTIQ